MSKRFNIRFKILLAFTVVALVTVSSIAVVSFSIGRSTLVLESFNKLTAVREMKASQIEDYFQLIQDQIITQSNDRMIIDAMKAFSADYYTVDVDLGLDTATIRGKRGELLPYYQDEFLERLVPNLPLAGETQEFLPSDEVFLAQEFLPNDKYPLVLQDLYILANPNETGSKHLLDNPGDGSRYSATHELYHPIVRDFLERFGYYDIFLVDPRGNIVYSVFKEVDFGTSLISGPYADTNFGEVFRSALAADEPEAVFIADFEPYRPSYNAPASFIASPVFDGDENIGVLIFQMPVVRINSIMTNAQNWSDVGLGESGETYLVGPDLRLRNQSRFLIEDSDNYFQAIAAGGVPETIIDRIRSLNSTIGLQEVDTEGTRSALSGETGTAIFPDYRGVTVLSSYKPLELDGLSWVIMSEIDEAEALGAISELGLRLAVASSALIAFIVLASFLFSRSLTRPLSELADDAESLSRGALDLAIKNTDREDEIGILAKNFEVMRVSLKEAMDEMTVLNEDLENRVMERTAELRASERQSNAIIEQSSDAIVVVDGEGKILVWNARAEQMFGLSAEEMSGQAIDRIVPQAYYGRHQQAMGQADQAGHLKNPGVTHELSAMRSDGSEFPIELSISQWGLGGKNYFSASIRDITERRQAERALREREERISSIVEIAPDAVISIDHQHEIIMFNSAAEEIFGYHADEVLGQPLTMLMPEGSRSIHSDEVEGFRTESVSARSMDARREIFGLRKNGETFPAEAGISKVELDGQVIFTAFLRDITERKRLEAEIADQLAFVSTLIDTVPNPIFAVGPDLRYSHFNRAYELAYGIEAKDQLGKTVMDIETLSLEQRRAYREQGLKLLEEGGTVQDEIEIPFSDGELHTILQWVQTFEKSDGAVGGYVGITADITEIKRLERELENANERMSTELNFARDIQISMLPLIFPAFPDRREVSINAALESAREVGGDFYDFYFLDDDHLAFIVGDVSGKGAPGALMMAVSKTLIKSRAADDSEPASILTHVNNELSEDNIASMFVTVFLAILNVRTGEMVYTNAGHNPPYIRRRNGSVRKLDAFHGPVIGAMPGMPYGQDKDQLVEGDIVLVYSDGVTEAFNEQEELYSEERLEELLRGESLNSDANIVTGIQESLREFVGHAEQSDDITLLAVHFLLGAEALETRELRLTIKNRYDEIGLVDEHFTSFAEENNIPDAARQAMSIVADELLNNIISYAYQGETERDIEVSFELSDDRLVLTIKDSGVPFNPFASESPDITTSIDERMIGGLGIHMVRNLMDDYSYQRQISKNVVTLVKRLDNEAEE